MDNKARIYFQISPASGVPLYRQIFDQVRIGVALGKFRPGDFVPSVRDVSAGLEINPMTVSKAYSLLERAGVLEFVRGQGMRVPAQAPEAAPDELGPLLREVVNRAQQLSLDRAAVAARLDKIWEGYSHE
jgi:GntR family transcriptional regulator